VRGTFQTAECGRLYNAGRIGARRIAFWVRPAKIRTTSWVRSLSSTTA
jgi:hypothetical protein